MRVVSRDELMRMPKGTVYSQWEPCFSTGLFVHDGPAGMGEVVDWYELDCLPQPDQHTEEVFLDDRSGREGMFAHEQQYVVYEKDDLDKLARMLSMRVLTVRELAYERAGESKRAE